MLHTLPYSFTSHELLGFQYYIILDVINTNGCDSKQYLYFQTHFNSNGLQTQSITNLSSLILFWGKQDRCWTSCVIHKSIRSPSKLA